jgi:hypothetical protein
LAARDFAADLDLSAGRTFAALPALVILAVFFWGFFVAMGALLTRN